MRKYYAKKFENLNKMDKFLEKYNIRTDRRRNKKYV